MKIYFAGSIRGGRGDQGLYGQIIEELGKYGSVLTEHVAEKTTTHLGEINLTSEFIFNRDMSWLKECDVVVAEVTTPSLGVGYEIGQAEVEGKVILCLYRQIEGKSLSAMISGNPALTTYKYENFEDISRFLEKHFREKGE